MSTAITTVRSLLQRDSVKNRLVDLLGSREAGTFTAAVVQLVNSKKRLARCKPETVLGAAITAAALRLPIDPNLGMAHIVPYGQSAQFQVGYKGFIQLAQRSGVMERFTDLVIPKGALIRWDPMREGLEADFYRDEVDWDDPKRDGYYCSFRTCNGFEKTVFMTYSQVYRHAERYSKSFGDTDSAWTTNFDSMALKTVISHALKRYAPLSIEYQSGIAKDQGVIDLEGNVDFVDNPNRASQGLPTAEVQDVTVEDVAKVQDASNPVEKEAPPPNSENDTKIRIKVIEGALLDAGINLAKFIAWLGVRGYVAKSAKCLNDVPAKKLDAVANNIFNLIGEYNG